MGPRGVLALLALSLVGFASARAPFMSPVDGPANDACQTCMISVRLLEDFLCDPAATDFLVDFVEKQICPAVGDTAQCHNLAEGLLPTLVQWFRASATPASLCSSAGVCGDTLAQVPMLTKPALRVHDGAECAMCKFVVGRVKAAINDSGTLEKIKEVALQLCGGLPNELATSCTDFVNSYEPMIAELVEDMDPDTVCALVGVCMESLVAHPPPPLPEALVRAIAASPILKRPPPPPLFLAMAKLGMTPAFAAPHPHPHGPAGGIMCAIARFFGFGPHHPDHDHEEEWGHEEWRRDEQAMQEGPRPLPRAEPEPEQGAGVMPFGGPMHGGPMQGGPMHDGPMNGGPMHGRNMMGGPMMMMGPPPNDACDYCKMAVIEAHSLISNPSVQAEVLNYTLAVCDNFPNFAQPCKTYVAVYAPLVFSLLEQYLVPDQLCAQTGMCPPPPHPGRGGEEVPPHPLSHPHPHGPLGWLLDGLVGIAQRIGLMPPPPHLEGGAVPAALLTRQEPEPEAAPRVEPPQ
ncbi:hypothetical protein GPECTOR_69g440 [Gonium pectorale]|uniref:Saposin B-type domain-containing protein n=1 Tax=Gonium pectorale TaxID=33097 RepID=A0A150G3B8_GONPE|nr:hypothetical protein GPECTOR_69g440 [Gonium pectorale]|eukprot:KXZ44347.1 hypothetical protein GPECTOR_69g440 [Gonium pectorale]